MRAREADIDRDRSGHEDDDAGRRIELVYREHGARMWRAVFLASGSREVADDAVAEAFAQALRRGSAVRDPAAWLWRVVFRLAAGELKERGRVERFEVESMAGLPDPFVDLWRALAKLPLKHGRRSCWPTTRVGRTGRSREPWVPPFRR